MKKFGIILLVAIFTASTYGQNAQKSADDIKEELKKLLGQEAQIYESKLRLLQQLQTLQQEVENPPPTTTGATIPPIPITVTRIVTPVEDGPSPTPLAIITAATTLPATTIPESSITQNPSATTPRSSVPDVVSYSEVRVDSPGILILNRGKRPVLVRS